VFAGEVREAAMAGDVAGLRGAGEVVERLFGAGSLDGVEEGVLEARAWCLLGRVVLWVTFAYVGDQGRRGTESVWWWC
jgi:hypothetical protein